MIFIYFYVIFQAGGDTTNWKAMKAANLPPRWVEDIEKTEEDISKIQLKSTNYLLFL